MLPFTPFMVQNFFHLKDDDPTVGYYSGLLVGVAAFAEFLGSYPIGVLSDRIGRRPVLLAGLVASTFFIPLFGFSSSFGMALAVRVCRGLSNSNLPYRDHDASNRARAFGLLVASFALGFALGPALGGALVRPSHWAPGSFPPGSLFDAYPYALPTVVFGAMSLAATLVGYFTLTETLAPCRPVSALAASDAAQPLATASGPAPVSARSAARADPRSPAADQASPRLPAAAWSGALCYALCSLAVAVYQQTFVLWAKLPRAEGGLRWPTTRIGAVQALGGLGILLAQTLLFPPVVARLGLKRTFQLSWLVPCLCWVATPFTASLIAPAAAALLAAMAFFWSLSISFTFTCAFLFTSNSVPRRQLGAANGIGQSLACIARTVGPLGGGSLVAALARRPPPWNEDLAFWLCAGLGLLSCALLRVMPVATRDYEAHHAHRRRKRAAAEAAEAEGSTAPLAAVRVVAGRE